MIEPLLPFVDGEDEAGGCRVDFGLRNFAPGTLAGVFHYALNSNAETPIITDSQGHEAPEIVWGTRAGLVRLGAAVFVLQEHASTYSIHLTEAVLATGFAFSGCDLASPLVGASWDAALGHEGEPWDSGPVTVPVSNCLQLAFSVNDLATTPTWLDGLQQVWDDIMRRAAIRAISEPGEVRARMSAPANPVGFWILAQLLLRPASAPAPKPRARNFLFRRRYVPYSE
jgi:hypothetical protein